jgi:hypothetical protein
MKDKVFMAMTIILLIGGVLSPSLLLYSEFGVFFVLDELFIGLYALWGVGVLAVIVTALIISCALQSNPTKKQ